MHLKVKEPLNSEQLRLIIPNTDKAFFGLLVRRC